MSRFRGRWIEYWPFWGFALIGIALAAWEGYSYHNKTTGTVVHAHVDDCRVDPIKGSVVTCVGTWVLGGRRAHGTVNDADIPDMGRTLTARVHGGTAYAHTRLAAPLVLFFVGLLFALGWLYAAWRNAGPPAAARRPSAG